jgi:polyhydroxyalkanoate synthesis repressor PhaR
VNSKNRHDTLLSEAQEQKSDFSESEQATPTPLKTGKNKKSNVEANAKRVIKKYPNRRLYDTSTSSYITLNEVKDLVMHGVGFSVVDAKTQVDLTRAVLLQVILEEETAGAPMFSAKILENMIRFYGHAMQTFMGSYLEQNVQSFVDLQIKMTQNSKSISPELWLQVMNMQAPMLQGMMGSYADESTQIFQKMQEQMQAKLQEQTEKMVESFNLKHPPKQADH